MGVAGDLKFKLALEDEGLSWDQAETVLRLAEENLVNEYVDRLNKARDREEEVNLLAYSAREEAKNWKEDLLDELEAYSKPAPGETVEELREALVELVDAYRYSSDSVGSKLADIEEITGGN